MATKPLSSSSDTPDKPPKPDPTPPGPSYDNLVEPILGTGGELYGDAHTTPDDEIINYPEDQDGVVVSDIGSAEISPPPEPPVTVPPGQDNIVDPAPESTL